MAWKKQKNLDEDFIEEKYFDDDDVKNNKQQPDGNDDEIDPLDLYMMELASDQKKESANTLPKKKEERIITDDPLDSYMDGIKQKLIKEHNKNYLEHKLEKNQLSILNQKKNLDDDKLDEAVLDAMNNEDADNQNYDFLDSDGELDFDAIKKRKKQKIEPLIAVDHSKVKYEEFSKNFYEEHEEIKNLESSRVNTIRKEMEIRVRGPDVPKPIVSFGHLNFDEKFIDLIAKHGFAKPTAIQCQALPCCLSGRDVVGIAKTGSGKTLAYVWPLLIHILDQRELEKNEGPIGVILCPTRELAQQVFLETKRYAKHYNISVSALLGGENKHDQWKELKAGVEIIIATPGRLIDMLKKKATNMRRCTYVVIDEADKMFSMGFEYQIRSILGQIRPDRQTLLFTATFKKKIQNLVMDLLRDPVIINVGEDNQANEDVTQEVVLIDNENQKYIWIVQNLPTFLQTGKVLIFVNQIGQCQDLYDKIKFSLGYESLVLHGDKLQQERTQIVNSFKARCDLMVATDVASRGLDIPNIKFVINYECPKDSDTHIHRVGRTGRAGDKSGRAYTLLMRTDHRFAALLVKNLELSGQNISLELEEVAMGDSIFKNTRMMAKLGYKKGKDASKIISQAIKKGKRDTAGLGYKEEDSLKAKLSKELDKSIALQKSLNEFSEAYENLQYLPIMAPRDEGVPINVEMQISSTGQQQMPTTRGPSRFQPAPVDSRQSILNDYSNRFKSQMQNQFRSNFTSAGSIQSKYSLPTITYINPPNNSISRSLASEEHPNAQLTQNNESIKFAESKVADVTALISNWQEKHSDSRDRKVQKRRSKSRSRSRSRDRKSRKNKKKSLSKSRSRSRERDRHKKSSNWDKK